MAEANKRETAFDVAAFIADLRRQREQYQALNALMDEQDALVASRNHDALLRLLEKKRAILDEVERVDRRMSPVKERWEELREGLSTEERAALQTILQEVGGTLRSLVTREENARKVIEERKDGNSGEMKKLFNMKRVRSAYGNGKEVDPRFVDRNDAGLSGESHDGR